MRNLSLILTTALLCAMAPHVRADEEPTPADPEKQSPEKQSPEIQGREYKPKGLGASLRDQATKAIQAGEHKQATDLYQRWLEADPRDETSWYNYACALSLLGRKDDALRAFETCIDAGFDDLDHASRDADLALIRDDARFAAALARGRSKAEERGIAGMIRHHVRAETLGTYVVLLPPDYESSKSSYPLCLILHGSGSTETNHARVTDRLGRKDVIYIAPRALHPHLGVIKQSGKPGFSVWPPERVTEGTSEEENGSAPSLDPMALHADYISRCVIDAQRRYRVRGNRVHVWGHSQGAASAMVFAARHPQRVKSVFAFAGYYPEAHMSGAALQVMKANGVHVSLCHGEKDTVVPYAPTIDMGKRLGKAGIPCDVIRVPGGHGVSAHVDRAGTAWVREHVLNVADK